MDHDPSPDDPTDRGAGDERWLGFADEPRLELDDALARVSELARSVEGAQGRLRSLLRANAAITADLRLPVVLRQIAEAARDLVGAKYAALGVVGADGELDQFIHVGMPQDVVERIGALPRGRGVLGMLVNHPEPIRLKDLTQHPAAAGFPVHHSPMGSFLGVPIRVGDRVFGNLYLTESKIGHFTRDDEQLVVALAGNAGVAIENARLYEKSERQRRWLDATAQVAQDLLAQQDGSPLDVVLRQALIASDADLASIVLKTGDTDWTVVASAGVGADAPGTPVELETSLVGRAITGATAVLVDERTTTALPEPWRSDAISTAIVAPLLTSANAASGALSLTRLKDRPAFVDEDLQQLIGFAGSVGVAIELDQARRDRELAHLADDRARIAADLHDHVIQVLFATGMSLQNVVALIDTSAAQSRVLESIDVLDDAIKQIRSTIFQLRAPIRRPAALHHRLLKVVEEQSPGLGFEPAVTLSGMPHLVDRDPGLSDDIVAVTREALANVARHAMASRADLDVILDASAVTVVVADDGQGIQNSVPVSGLLNLRRRAEARAGHLRVEPRDGGGTRLIWTAPLHAVNPDFPRDGGTYGP